MKILLMQNFNRIQNPCKIHTIYQFLRLFHLKNVTNNLSGDKLCCFQTLSCNEFLEKGKFSFINFGMSEKITWMLDFHSVFGQVCPDFGRLKIAKLSPNSSLAGLSQLQFHLTHPPTPIPHPQTSSEILNLTSKRVIQFIDWNDLIQST